MALVCGTERKLAEDFSFALAVVLTPPVIGRGLYRLLRDANADTHVLDLLVPGIVGMGLSFVAGLLALKQGSSMRYSPKLTPFTVPLSVTAECGNAGSVT